MARFLNRIGERGALRPDITIAEATEWLVDVHITLLSPLFADRSPDQRARTLHNSWHIRYSSTPYHPDGLA